MALNVTKFDRALRYKIVQQTDTTTTINHNVADGPCTLHSIVFDNVQGSATNYVRCADGRNAAVATSLPRVSMPCPGRSKRTIEFPDGVPFERSLSFWCSSSKTPVGTGAPATTIATGTIQITLVVS